LFPVPGFADNVQIKYADSLQHQLAIAGEIKVNTGESEFTAFIIQIPV
jgi:hypothetical protein